MLRSPRGHPGAVDRGRARSRRAAPAARATVATASPSPSVPVGPGIPPPLIASGDTGPADSGSRSCGTYGKTARSSAFADPRYTPRDSTSRYGYRAPPRGPADVSDQVAYPRYAGSRNRNGANPRRTTPEAQ